MGSYTRNHQRDDLTTALKYKRPKAIIRFIVVVALFGSCLNLLQNNPEVRESRSPVYSSGRNLKEVDFSSLRSLVKIIDGKAPGDNCEWVEPKMLNESTNSDLFSTILVAYPGSAKRAAFLQLEGLTELMATDDYNLNEDQTDVKYAFVKTQYPHHEGIWSWGARGNQTVYVLQNPRTALQTYMFLLHEIHYSNGWWTSYANIPRTFTLRPVLSEWEDFKEARFAREVQSWGWHLEYWMENGLFRDVFTHQLTTPEGIEGIMNPSIYSAPELASYQEGLSNVNATWDKHCVEGDMPYCVPVAIVSYEKLMDPLTGPSELAKLAAVIQNQPGMNVVDQIAWDCVWNEVVLRNDTGVRVDANREGPEMDNYSFTVEEVKTILIELERLKEKYSSESAQLAYAGPVYGILVTYLDEYITDQKNYLATIDNLV